MVHWQVVKGAVTYHSVFCQNVFKFIVGVGTNYDAYIMNFYNTDTHKILPHK